MADIAFLLLVFFLVTTTFSKENQVEEKLPRKTDDLETKLYPHNILEILANKNDRILIEGEFDIDDPAEIADYVRDFFIHPSSEDNEKWPEVKKVTKQFCVSQLDELNSKLAEGQAGGVYADSVESLEKQIYKYENKLMTCELLGGSYNEISPKAVIAITLDNSTKYSTYIAVLDGILTGLTDLRDELSIKHFKKPYTELDKDIPEEADMIEACQTVYPKRIFKAKGIASDE